MIGYTVNAKVKRFARANHKGKVLITREFLDALDAEVERVVTVSVEKADKRDAYLTKLVVDVPDTQITDRLICDVRIKEQCGKVGGAGTACSKRFLTDLNTYVGATIITSLTLMQGVYLQNLVIGNATAKVAARVQAETEAETEAVPSTPITSKGKPIAKIEPCLPRDHVTASFEVCVQQAILVGSMRIFTSKTSKQITRSITQIVTRHLVGMGITETPTVRLLDTKREKDGK